jgi:hypothetical protein
MRFKQFAALFAVCAVLLSGSAFAADGGKHYDFAVTADGGGATTVFVGDTVTVAVTLTQQDIDSITMYALQDRVIYDSGFFELIEGSLTTNKGITHSTQTLTGNWLGWVGIHSNALSSDVNGTDWENPKTLVTFQVKTLKAGTSVILHREHVMSVVSGMDEYESSATNATVIIKTAVAGEFADVEKDAWYYDAVHYAAEAGLIEGVSPTKSRFAPDAPTTRAVFVAALAKLSGVETSEALDWGVTQGITDGTSPDAPITREQLAVMLWRYIKSANADISANGELNKFADSANVSDWAKDAVAWAVGAAIINGSDGAINPQGTATRAQTAQILLNLSKDLTLNAEAVKNYEN